MSRVQGFSQTRRDFLKGLGLLALSALPACRRAQEYAVAAEECPEWMQPGEASCYATAIPWANGAIPLLAVCHNGLPTSLQANPLYPHRHGLPAWAQASILDLYDARRLSTPRFNAKSYPWNGIRGALRAWCKAIQQGRKTAFLFPEGYSPLRQQLCSQFKQYSGVRFYAYDGVCEARPHHFDALQKIQESALGAPCRFDTGFSSLDQLVSDLSKIELLFILSPADAAAHHAPFAEALQTTQAETIRLCLFEDTTAKLCQYIIPQTHFLEEWGIEADAYGNYCLRQPIVSPLVSAVSEAALLLALLYDGSLPQNLTHVSDKAKPCIADIVGDISQSLRSGIVKNAAPRPTIDTACPRSSTYLHPYFVDGRFLHNRWLQETYDALSGTAGMPAVYLPADSPHIHGISIGPYQLPVSIIPGLQKACFPALPGIREHSSYTPISADFPHSSVQSLPAQKISSYTPPALPAPQWGMTINISACIGCGACLLACRAENNIPTVGLKEMIRQRDLQWLRIDRYLDESRKRFVFVPMACRQCGNAPCESVCPVNATVHTSDGLNAMVYPRCWGTRYCSATCPYQARTFNFHDYARQSQASTQLPANPDVTVRSRGVMEKCTYCVQRINRSKAENSTPQTACQAACPTQAIRLIDLVKEAPSTICTSFDSPGTDPHTLYLI